MHCSIALQILPQYVDEKKLLEVVDTVIRYLESQVSPENITVSPFETTLQGDYDDLMALLKKAIQLAGEDGVEIFANVKVSYCEKGDVLTIEDKLSPYRD